MEVTYAQTPKGNHFRVHTRPEVNDQALVMGILGTDEYGLAALPPLTGVALDIGAHVGTVALALAADNPDLTIVAVEPIPDNVAMIRDSVRLNGWEGRIHVLEASLGPPGTSSIPCRYGYTRAGEVDPGFVQQNAYVGNIWRLDITAESESIDSPVVTLDGLAEKYDVDVFSFTKIDCEGCEWEGLKKGAARLGLILGEWHDSPVSKLATLLKKTHDVSVVTDYGGSGIFRADPR